jgi:hypothetical protein
VPGIGDGRDDVQQIEQRLVEIRTPIGTVFVSDRIRRVMNCAASRITSG